jgi:DNA-binding MarR family transcriptional regulator
MSRPEVTGETQEILDSFRRLVQELRLADREAEGKLGLSGAQLFVLQKLGEEPSMSVNDLAERTRTHQSSVSVVVHRLVDRRLVKRKESQSDRRRLELSITADGKKLLARSRYSPQDRLIDGIESMPARDRKQLAGLLTELVEAMGISAHPPEMFFETERRATARQTRPAENEK